MNPSVGHQARAQVNCTPRGRSPAPLTGHAHAPRLGHEALPMVLFSLLFLSVEIDHRRGPDSIMPSRSAAPRARIISERRRPVKMRPFTLRPSAAAIGLLRRHQAGADVTVTLLPGLVNLEIPHSSSTPSSARRALPSCSMYPSPPLSRWPSAPTSCSAAAPRASTTRPPPTA